jgi:hypothetical protein
MRFPEIIQQGDAAATIALDKPQKGIKVDAGHTLFMVGFLIYKILDFSDIRIRKQQETMGSQPVASGPAYLLVIAFDIFWHIIMDDEPDIRLVYPHPEGYGGHNDVHIVIDEQLLVLFSLDFG